MTSVAIIIAAYNARSTIARAIASALAQAEVTQVIVVDDASTDDTVAVVQSLDDDSGRLTLLVQPHNAGPSAARNLALAACKAEWVGVLDADDFFLPRRIQTLLAHGEHADMIADDMWQVSEADIEGARTALLGNLTAPMAIDLKSFVLSNVTKGNKQRKELGFIKPLMRMRFLTQHRLQYHEAMRLGEDFELYTRALAAGARLWIIPEQGYVSVVRASSLSGKHSEHDLRYLRDCTAAIAHDFSLQASEQEALRAHYESIDCRLQWRLLILAVKQRKLRTALACFLRPWPVPLVLCQQLFEQLLLRSGLKAKK
jgi:succinoglycan biosynthesis protein ExoU